MSEGDKYFQFPIAAAICVRAACPDGIELWKVYVTLADGPYRSRDAGEGSLVRQAERAAIAPNRRSRTIARMLSDLNL